MASPNRYLALAVILALLAETGVALVLYNARPDAPPGFRLWFGGIGALAVLLPAWLFWKARKSGERSKPF